MVFPTAAKAIWETKKQTEGVRFADGRMRDKSIERG
jgi:hypothetical protein